MRKPIWKKAEAEKAIRAIAAKVAEAFNIPAPVCFVPDYLTGAEWEWRFDTVEVWTKAGRAEMCVDINSGFAHMYFRFDDPARAICFDDCHDRLNRHSGKWNSLESAGNSLSLWIEELTRDFAKVAQPNPPADEVAAYRLKEAEANARWAAALEPFAAVA